MSDQNPTGPKPPTVPKDQQSCSICYAYVPSSESLRGGFCQLNPPFVLMRPPVGTDTSANPEPFWPEVSPTDWCAQWANNL